MNIFFRNYIGICTLDVLWSDLSVLHTKFPTYIVYHSIYSFLIHFRVESAIHLPSSRLILIKKTDILTLAKLFNNYNPLTLIDKPSEMINNPLTWLNNHEWSVYSFKLVSRYIHGRKLPRQNVLPAKTKHHRRLGIQDLQILQSWRKPFI